MSKEKTAIDSLQEKGWLLVKKRQHLLGRLQGKGLSSYKLIVLLGPKNKIGAHYFQVFLKNKSGETGKQPVVTGLQREGEYPSYNWVEIINVSTSLTFGAEEQTLGDDLIKGLFQYLADLIPPGGHMMVEYESPQQQSTAQSLALGIPPVATSLGYMLFSVGCGAGFRDWHFAEGGSEGPRKLQGYKVLDEEHGRLKTEEVVKEVTAFLERLTTAEVSPLEAAARRRALAILGELNQS